MKTSQSLVWLFVAAGAAAGCSSSAAPSSDGDPQEAVDSGAPGVPVPSGTDAATPVPEAGALQALRVLPKSAYSGVDGAHEFSVPVGVYGAGTDVTLTASDPALVTIAPAHLVTPAGDTGIYFLVTAKQAGHVVLTALSQGRTITSELTIAAYTPDRYGTGKTRYENGAPPDPACTTCHSASTGIDHSPAALASATDADVVTVITSGMLASGGPITAVKHKWTVSDAEQKGLVTYLRALPPRGFAPGN